MRYKVLLKEIKAEEGHRPTPYLCSKRKWTISYGFTSVDGVKVSQYMPMLSEETEQRNLHAHIFRSLNIAMRYVNNFCELSDDRQEVLINMAYQLGTRLLNFTKTKMYIEQRNWEQASIEMLDSNWNKQTPHRAKRMSEKFK